MKKSIALISAIAILSTSIKLKPVQANPALIAPITLCSNPVTCLFLGTVVIGGVIYYVWENQHSHQKAKADRSGNVYTDDISGHDVGRVIKTNKIVKTLEDCQKYADKFGNDYGGIWQAIEVESIGISTPEVESLGKIESQPIYRCVIKRIK